MQNPHFPVRVLFLSPAAACFSPILNVRGGRMISLLHFKRHFLRRPV
jgi:hypothetical protein